MNVKLKQCSGCGEMKVIWKNDEGEKYCKICWSKKMPPKFPQQSKVLPVRSKKRAVLDQIYSTLRKQFLGTHPYCLARLDSCTAHATDIHHKSGRSKQYLNQVTWLPVCRSCHQYIEQHPIEAKELGFSNSRINDIDSD
jgi:hypothetical protein